MKRTVLLLVITFLSIAGFAQESKSSTYTIPLNGDVKNASKVAKQIKKEQNVASCTYNKKQNVLIIELSGENGKFDSAENVGNFIKSQGLNPGDIEIKGYYSTSRNEFRGNNVKD